MNQQRLRAYINLIQNLLACPSGEEWILLRQNEALVTPELVRVMEQVAAQLANQGNLKEAKFLHNLASQIHHLFIARTIQRSDDEDQSKAYLELIQALLDCPKGSEGELLAANQELIGPGLVQMMQQVATQMEVSGDQEAANYLKHWATELDRLWLQQHDFQPALKKEPEPKHLDDRSVAAPSTPPTTSPSPAQPTVPQPSSPALAEELEDFWAEPSEEPVQTSPHPLPIPEPEPVKPASVQDVAPAPPEPAIYEQINRNLETIAGVLTQISEALTPQPQPPTDPLWYMEVLERACAGNWVLTSAEIQTLIGVQPICHRGDESFQRGCWVFVKAGKVGTQNAWRVTKEKAQE
jgi:hypothetical protein